MCSGLLKCIQDNCSVDSTQSCIATNCQQFFGGVTFFNEMGSCVISNCADPCTLDGGANPFARTDAGG